MTTQMMAQTLTRRSLIRDDQKNGESEIKLPLLPHGPSKSSTGSVINSERNPK